MTSLSSPLRRRLLLAAATFLSACGGNAVTPQSSVTDRHIAVGAAVTLHVRDWRNLQGDDADVIVLLGGLGANAHAYDSLAPALARRHRVLAVTRRGYGQSGKPAPADAQTYAPATLVADLLAVLDALKVQRVILAGHSIAGNEVTLFAGTHPQRVRGLVYLDTTFDYHHQYPWPDEKDPDPALLAPPSPTAADMASMAASITYARQLQKRWWPATEAYWRDSLAVLPDGSVYPNTPDEVASSMDLLAHAFSPDYRKVVAPALVVHADPGSLRDMMPWLTPRSAPEVVAEATRYLRAYRIAHAADCARIAAALPGSTLVTLHHANHSDFLMEHESTVVSAIEAMRWLK